MDSTPRSAKAGPAAFRALLWRGIATGAFWLAFLAGTARGAEIHDGSGREAMFARLNLPGPFAEKMRQREAIDRYIARFHSVAPEVEGPVLTPPAPGGRSTAQAIRIVRAEVPPAIRDYRLPLEKPVAPLRGFRAPILAGKSLLRPVSMESGGLSATERSAAEWIEARLAQEGLLAALGPVVETIGPEKFLTNAPSAMESLWRAGFPVDLLSFFASEDGRAGRPEEIVSEVARRLQRGESRDSIRAGMGRLRFQFTPTNAGFRAAEETGENGIGLVRLQVGSGFNGGVLRGGIIDVAGQLLKALPEAAFLATVADDYFANIEWLARNSWRLRRPEALTLVFEPGPVRAWAQDNGKAGTLPSGPTETRRPATIAPRYASQDEVNSPFFGGESFLMDGLAAAGHPVVHSPLLFQGGNVMMARDPARNEALLLVSETEICRNTALGLSREQVVEAFRIEFGANRCLVLPAASYHLDYDVTLRRQEGGILAFVNDADTASLLLARRGIDALLLGDGVPQTTGQALREDLAKREFQKLRQAVLAVCKPHLTDRNTYRAELVRRFAAGASESAAFNFQCFLGALDWLCSAGQAGAEADGGEREYFTALRGLRASARAQQEEFSRLGWKVVAVPSMPDLGRSVNYLNGLQDRTRFLMPAVGGFFSELDDAAEAAFRKVLGTQVEVVRVYNLEAQMKNGGLHCVAAVYPATGNERR